MDGGLTTEGQMLGTPDYIAPEQILDAISADIRADLYSLGCTLYHLLTGRPPFQANSLYDMYQAHISRDADPLNLVRPDVPAGLAALVAKMMAKDPGERFQTPVEVAQALAPFIKKADPAARIPAARVEAATLPYGPEASPPAAPATSKAAGDDQAWDVRVETRDKEVASVPAPSAMDWYRRPWIWGAAAAAVILLGPLAAWLANRRGDARPEALVGPGPDPGIARSRPQLPRSPDDPAPVPPRSRPAPPEKPIADRSRPEPESPVDDDPPTPRRSVSADNTDPDPPAAPKQPLREKPRAPGKQFDGPVDARTILKNAEEFLGKRVVPKDYCLVSNSFSRQPEGYYTLLIKDTDENTLGDRQKLRPDSYGFTVQADLVNNLTRWIEANKIGTSSTAECKIIPAFEVKSVPIGGQEYGVIEIVEMEMLIGVDYKKVVDRKYDEAFGVVHVSAGKNATVVRGDGGEWVTRLGGDKYRSKIRKKQEDLKRKIKVANDFAALDATLGKAMGDAVSRGMANQRQFWQGQASTSRMLFGTR